jgi:hypothetical protein
MPHDEVGEAAFHLSYRGLLIFGEDAAYGQFFEVVEARGRRMSEILIPKGQRRPLNVQIFVERRIHGVFDG